MAISSIPLKLSSMASVAQTPSTCSLVAPQNYLNYASLSPNPKYKYHEEDLLKRTIHRHSCCYSCRISYRFSDADEAENDDGDTEGCSFDEAVALFNSRDYYRCHDFLEALWNKADDPIRTLIHGILQCAVGFHHLFNLNHRGAMIELGEGLCKLRKMNFDSGPFHQFEQEISVVLDFIYQTQTELAACTEDLCLTMDGTERSYQLLGDFAAGHQVYCLQSGPNETTYIVFSPQISYGAGESPRVKLPTLHATAHHLSLSHYN